MNREELYRDWIRQHREMHVDESFADEVMNRLHRIESEKSMSRFAWTRMMNWIACSPWARAAAVTMAALLGLGRILLTLRLLLFA